MSLVLSSNASGCAAYRPSTDSRPCLAWLMPLLLAIAPACSTAYLKAAGTFGTAVANSSTQLQGITSNASELCYRRAQFDYLFKRLKSPETPYWPQYLDKATFDEKQVDGSVRKETWTDHCGKVAMADSAVTKALNLIGAYGKALQDISGGDYSGKNVSTVVTDVSKELTNLKAKPPAAVTDVLTGLAAPLGGIAGMLEKDYANSKVKEAVKDADPGVKAALSIIISYEADVDLESQDADDLLNNALQAADKAAATNPAAILELDELGGALLADLRTRKKQEAAISRTLSGLLAAETSLATAGSKDSGSDEFKQLLQAAAGLLSGGSGSDK